MTPNFAIPEVDLSEVATLEQLLRRILPLVEGLKKQLLPSVVDYCDSLESTLVSDAEQPGLKVPDAAATIARQRIAFDSTLLVRLEAAQVFLQSGAKILELYDHEIVRLKARIHRMGDAPPDVQRGLIDATFPTILALNERGDWQLSNAQDWAPIVDRLFAKLTPISDDPEVVPASEVARIRGVVKSGHKIATIPKAIFQIDTFPPGSAPAVLLVIAGADKGRVYSLAPGVPLTLGRGLDSELRFEDESISRSHATLTLRGTSLWVHDLGSMNGIASASGESRRLVLSSGEVLILGDTTACFLPAGEYLGRLPDASSS